MYNFEKELKTNGVYFRKIVCYQNTSPKFSENQSTPRIRCVSGITVSEATHTRWRLENRRKQKIS